MQIKSIINSLITIIIIIIFPIIISCSSESSNQNTTYDVILMGGQTNMVGTGFLSRIGMRREILPDNFIYYNQSVWVKFGNIRNVVFGPEVGLSTDLSHDFPNRKFILIKYAVAGSSTREWIPPKDQDKKTPLNGNQNKDGLYEKFINMIRTKLKGKKYNIRALCWINGEADSKTLDRSNNYYKNFLEFINKIRTDTNNSNLPVIFCEVNVPESKYPYVKNVQKSQEKLAKEIAHAFLVNTEKFPKYPDGVHFDSKGQILIGKEFAKILKNIIPH